jgi:hypothetical protein
VRRAAIAAALLLVSGARAATLPRLGDYLDTAYIKSLEKTRSPLAAAAADRRAAMPELVTLHSQGGARRLEATWNWHAGRMLFVLQRNGMVRRELAWGPDSGMALRLTAADAFCLTPRQGGEHCYRYVGDAPRFITSAALAGTYTDRQGKVYRFGADGTVHFPGYDARYRLVLDQAATPFDCFEIDATGGTIAFRHDGATLSLYGVRTNQDHADFTAPLAVLREAPGRALLAAR